MGPWLRSHGRPRSRHPASPLAGGFNGAVASQPRKESFPHDLTSSFRLLQWGRGFAATEGGDAGTTAVGGRRASMGPWLRSHGRAAGSMPTSRPASGLQWGRGFAATEGACCTVGVRCPLRLQWGRGFAATEGWDDSLCPRAGKRASMGPWLRSHGRPPEPPATRLRSDASMGPWLRSHGR